MADTPPTLWAGVPTSIDPSNRIQLLPGSFVTTTALDTAIGSIEQAANNAMGRNQFQNANFGMTQTGAGPFTSAYGYTVDRWITWSGGASPASTTNIYWPTAAEIAAIGSESTEAGLQVAFTGAAGAGSLVAIRQGNEYVGRFSGKTWTISFWARAATGTPRLGVGVMQFFGTGGTPSAQVWVPGQSVQISTTFQRYSVTIAVPSIAGMTIGTNNDDVTYVDFYLTASADLATRSGGVPVQTGTIILVGPQMEEGTERTGFERVEPSLNILRAKRYFQNGQSQIAGSGFMAMIIPFPVYMRATPTLTVTNTFAATGMSYQALAPVINSTRLGVNSSFFQIYADSGSINTAFNWRFDWTADARIP